MLFKRLPWFLSFSLASLLCAGCQPEENIAHHKIPHLNDMNRLLGAIVLPDKEDKAPKTWFFKVVGAESEMAHVVAPFQAFLRGVAFNSTGEPSWLKLPQGWQEDKNGKVELRFATITIGPKLKLTVSELSGAASIDANVNRWRRQLGLVQLIEPDGSPSPDLELFLQPEVVGGRDAVVVDMVGPRNDAAMPLKLPPKAPHAEAPGADKLSFTFKTPEGWQQIPPISQFYVLSFRDKTGKVAINVSDFKGDGGGVLQNVNRWRNQLKLEPIDQAQADALPGVAIGNATGKIVDIASPEKVRIVSAILIRPMNSLFFKMMGPSDLVEKEKPAFEAFLKSINFGS